MKKIVMDLCINNIALRTSILLLDLFRYMFSLNMLIAQNALLRNVYGIKLARENMNACADQRYVQTIRFIANH